MSFAAPTRPYLDLVPSADSTLDTEVERVLALGASRAGTVDGDSDGDGGDRVELADPDGHRFCVQPRPPTAG